MLIDKIFNKNKYLKKSVQNFLKKQLICQLVLIQYNKINKIYSKIKLNKNNNKILALLQPIKKRKTLSINSGKISEKILNQV